MEKQLEEFVQENERISSNLYQRDQECERVTRRNMQALERSQ